MQEQQELSGHLGLQEVSWLLSSGPEPQSGQEQWQADWPLLGRSERCVSWPGTGAVCGLA